MVKTRISHENLAVAANVHYAEESLKQGGMNFSLVGNERELVAATSRPKTNDQSRILLAARTVLLPPLLHGAPP